MVLWKDFDAERKAILEEGNGLLQHKHEKNGSTRNHWQKDGRQDASREDRNYPKGLIISFNLKKSSQEKTGDENESANITSKQNSVKATDEKKSLEATDNVNSVLIFAYYCNLYKGGLQNTSRFDNSMYQKRPQLGKFEIAPNIALKAKHAYAPNS
eukprot:Gb_00795 [translate_table: standard]